LPPLACRDGAPDLTRNEVFESRCRARLGRKPAFVNPEIRYIGGLRIAEPTKCLAERDQASDP
jgi:hypothetical protein